MSIAPLCDHRAIAYRATEVRDELQDVARIWDALDAPAGRNCRPNQAWSGVLQDHGPGEQPGSLRQWFLLPTFDVRERDVLSVESGPEAPVLLWVHQVTRATNPLSVHHLEVNVAVWKGSLTEEATS